MDIHRNARLKIETTVPPGESIVGVFPHEVFRVEVIDTLRDQPKLYLVRAGRHVACNGQEHRVQGYERTLCLGSFLALHVRNEGDLPAPLCLELRGLALGKEEVDHQLVRGFFTMEAAAEPSPEERTLPGT